MSSILDALKKAERESAADRRTDAPWPMLPSPSPYRQRPSRRWWIVLGFVAVLAVSGLVVLALRRPETTQPALSVAVLPPSVRTRDGAPPPPIAAVPAPSTAVAGKTPSSPARSPVTEPPVTETPVSRRPVTAIPLRREGQPASPSAVAGTSPAVQPVKPPSPDATALPQPTVPPVHTRNAAAAPAPEPAAVPATVPKQPHAETTTATGQGSAEPPDTEKTFRSDPRIDLQALVWAPDAAVRFVVINNRLIKEGGSVDNISVVKINPDDVLLAEGSDRWHVQFKVR